MIQSVESGQICRDSIAQGDRNLKLFDRGNVRHRKDEDSQRSQVIGCMNTVRSRRMRKLIGMLVAIQVIQISNLLPLLLDPRPEFLLGVVINLSAGILAGPVAYVVWTGRKYGPMIALLFAMFAFCSAAYLQCLVVAQSGEAFPFPPLTISLIMIAINVTTVILLLLFSGLRLLQWEASRSNR